MFEKFRIGVRGKSASGRSRRKSIIASIVFGAIILVFVFFNMVGDTIGVAFGGQAATVNNKVITVASFNRELETQMRRTGMKSFDNEMQRKFYKERALDSLIQTELISQLAKDEGVWSTDAEVRDQIINEMPYFREDDRFRPQLYYQTLERNGWSPAEFETIQKKSNQLMRIRRVFGLALKPTKLEAEKEMIADATKVNVEFVRLNRNLFAKEGDVKPSDLKAFLLKEDTEQKVKEYFEQNKTEFTEKEQVQARHILIQAKEGDKAAEDKAFDEIKKIAERVKTEDFSKVAKEVSQDESSKVKGGDLGFFSRGRMVPQFDAVAFNLEQGKVSSPVKTRYGYHIIKVENKKAEKSFGFDEVKDQISRKLAARERWQSVRQEFSSELKAKEFKNVERLVKRHNLKWEETGLFGMEQENIPKVGMDEEFATEAFGLSKDSRFADRLVGSADQFFVIKMKEKKEARIDEPELKKLQERLHGQTSMAAFSDWLKVEWDKANITKNQQVLEN